MTPASPDEPIRDLAAEAKAQMRARRVGLGQALPKAAAQARACAVADRVGELVVFAEARVVAVFESIGPWGTVPIRPLLDLCEALGKVICYPQIPGCHGGVLFRRLDSTEDLVDSGFPFLEIREEAALITEDQVDLVILPVIAADPNGAFIDHGSGVYDLALRTLVSSNSVAVAFDFQLIPESPRSEGDMTVDWVVTDSRVLGVRSSRPAVRRAAIRTRQEVDRGRQDVDDAGSARGTGNRLGDWDCHIAKEDSRG